MNENLVVEIQKIEDKADNIIADAYQKARQLDADAEDEIKKLTIDFERKFQENIERLKARTENSTKDEAAHLMSEFEKLKAKLTELNQAVIEQAVESVVKEICEPC